MAAGNWVMFETCKRKLINGTMDIDSDTLIAVPLNSTYTPNAVTHEFVADVEAAEVTGDGGASLRQTLAGVALSDVTVGDPAEYLTRLSADDVVMNTTEAVTIKYLAIIDDTVTDDPLVAYVDLETTNPDGLTVTQLTTQFPNGIFTLKVA